MSRYRTETSIMTGKTVQAAGEKFRIDKWLFAARFFKTRSLAAEAIERGRVQLNGVRAKPARTLAEGDALDIRIGPYRYQVTVLALSNKRGPATEARKLYQETDESRQERERMAASGRLSKLSNSVSQKAQARLQPPRRTKTAGVPANGPSP